ncbi:PaaI family thioesterase [Pelagerythrobacter aerophilus]|uniref:PaaI family thioesterase n=1 Tax=Pelagerythrobacter aerophilus TaxID=2306995 RepID=A0A418NJA1_9SPHN|nr:PaaI family thioesterase [Pelagerythrobacter aerophilus]RIV79259.1 PaaI family thioesterase [Pelagerythrobacter aerophilus]
MASDLPPFDPATAATFMLQHGHPGWLGMRYVAHGADWVELALPWREDLVGETGSGILATGPIVSLMDMASGMAIWTATSEFLAIATLDLRVDYMRPARKGAAVNGRSECYRRTRSAAFVRGIAHDGDPDDPVAHVAGVFMSIGGRRDERR